MTETTNRLVVVGPHRESKYWLGSLRVMVAFVVSFLYNVRIVRSLPLLLYHVPTLLCEFTHWVMACSFGVVHAQQNGTRDSCIA